MDEREPAPAAAHLKKGGVLIARDHPTTLVALGVLALGAFFCAQAPTAALARHHSDAPAAAPPAALAASDLASATVTLALDGVATTVTTTANNVDAFLRERNISVAQGDTLSVAGEDLILDGMTISYTSAASKISSANADDAIWLASDKPSLSAMSLHAPSAKSRAKKLAHAADAARTALAAHVVRPVRAAVVAAALGEYVAFAEMAKRGFVRTLRAADSVMRMMATAYTASCYGCSGITALGYHAGHGIVAVDPRVIPLGTHLFIPGYGQAIAGDTGGAIKGSRIDLGFNSFSDAMRFGRREITVYVINGRVAARR